MVPWDCTYARNRSDSIMPVVNSGVSVYVGQMQLTRIPSSARGCDAIRLKWSLIKKMHCDLEAAREANNAVLGGTVDGRERLWVQASPK